MANVRIKDITTTASAPNDDDYLAIDGATGGTRKILADNIGVSDDIKTALLQIASKVAYIDDDGQDYYDDLYDALYPSAPPAALVSISAVYTQSGTVYSTDSLDVLKSGLVVTALYDDSNTVTLSDDDYVLSGALTGGTSTITVSYSGKTTTFEVTVTAWDNYNYSLSNGQLIKLIGSTSAITAHPGLIEYDSSNANRRSYPTLKAGVKSLSSKTDNYNDTIYYPIPIPQDAVKATISITPNTQFHGESMYTYNSGTGYTRQLDPGWKQGEFTHTFSAGVYDYITVASKYNTAGSSYPTEPTELTITFLTE